MYLILSDLYQVFVHLKYNLKLRRKKKLVKFKKVNVIRYYLIESSDFLSSSTLYKAQQNLSIYFECNADYIIVD